MAGDKIKRRRRAELWEAEGEHEILERNGNLILVRNEEGDEAYVCPFEVRREF